MKKVSVIVPIYNMEKRLSKCLDSLTSQTLKDIEIILINDGSTDNSLEIINSYAKKYKNIIVINKKNNGISAARNDGLEVATGNYIGFVDSDDFAELDMFENMYNIAEDTESDLVICNYKTFNNIDDSIIYNNVVSSTKITTLEKNPEILNKIHFMPWNKLYKKELFNDIKFPLNTKYEDLSTIIKVFSKAKKVNAVDEYLYNYFLNSKGETLTVDKRIFDILKILNDILLFFKKEKSNEIKQQLEYLCINKLIQYITLSYNLTEKKDSIEFIKHSLEFLNKNFKGYKIRYIKHIKSPIEFIKFIIRTNLLLSKILLKFK